MPDLPTARAEAERVLSDYERGYEDALRDVEEAWVQQGKDSGGWPLTQSGKLWANEVRRQKAKRV